jgi:hypothetical protein
VVMFLKRVRCAVLVACYVIVVRACSLFHISLPMNSFFRPHNMRRFRPYYVVPRVSFKVTYPPRR